MQNFELYLKALQFAFAFSPWLAVRPELAEEAEIAVLEDLNLDQVSS